MIAFIDDHREAHGVEPIWLLVGLAGFIYPIIPTALIIDLKSPNLSFRWT